MSSVLGYLVLAFLAASAVWCYWRPSFAVALVLTMYPLKQLEMSYLPVFVTNSTWFNFIIFACVAVATLSNLIRSRETLVGYANKFFLLMLALYVFALFTILYTPSQAWAMDRARDGGPYWIMQVLMLPLVVTSIDDFRKAVTPAVIIGVGICALFFLNPKTVWHSGRLVLNIGEFAGVADYRGNPLATAQMGGHIALLAALMSPSRAAWLMHGVRLAGVFLGLGIAVAAGSRGQLGIAIIVMVLFYPLARKVRDVKQFFVTAGGLALMGGLVVVSLAYFLGQDREQATRWDVTQWGDNLSGRGWEAWILMDAWWENPAQWLFGLGVNAYSFYRGESHSYAHNILIEMLGELGIFGLSVFLLLCWWLYKASRDLFDVYRDDPLGRASVAVLLGQGAYLGLLSLKQGTFVSIPEPWYMWVLIVKFAEYERRLAAAAPAGESAPGEGATGESWSGYEDVAATYAEREAG